MSIFDLFSFRQAMDRDAVPDVYQYDLIPETLRVQIVHILKDALGSERDYAEGSAFQVAKTYEFIVKQLCREYGVFELTAHDRYADQVYMDQLFRFLLTERSVERVLDAVELSCRSISKLTSEYAYRHRVDARMEAAAAIAELNERFKRAACGYRFESGQILRVDSEFVHAAVVKPALNLLSNKMFAGAEAEFLSAHEHLRHGRHKEALVECVKAFESTMKIMAGRRKWQHDPKATAKPLLELMFNQHLVPAFWSQHFSSFRALLESGVPTARNRGAGHGQGQAVTAVPESIAVFALNQTASALVYLVSADSELP